MFLALFLFAPSARADAPADAEKAVRALERAWLDAYEQLDSTAMKSIVADDFLITFPDGSTQTKRQILSDLEAGRKRPPETRARFHTEGVSARTYGNTVILTGIVVTTSTREGKKREDRSRYTDTYVARDGKWQVVASHLSNAPAPSPAR
jgi:uncharacterized protein (TIGR02246 family)